MLGYLLYGTVIGLNAVPLLRKNRNNLALYLSIFFMSIFVGFYAISENIDLSWYLKDYSREGYASLSHYEPGYVFLSYIFKSLRIPFPLFRSIGYLAFSLLICYALRVMQVNRHIFFLLYSVSFLLFTSNTIRYSMGLAVILFSLQFLYRRKYILYVCSSLIAAFCFHITLLPLVFGVVTATPKKHFKWVEKILYVINAFGLLYICVLIVYPGAYIGLKECLHFLVEKLLPVYTDYHFVNNCARIYSIYAIYYVANYIILWTGCYIINKNADDLKERIPDFEAKALFCERIRCLVLMLGPVCVTVLININMFRYLMIGMLFSYVAYAMMIQEIVQHKLLNTPKYYGLIAILFGNALVWNTLYLLHHLGYYFKGYLINNDAYRYIERLLLALFSK